MTADGARVRERRTPPPKTREGSVAGDEPIELSLTEDARDVRTGEADDAGLLQFGAGARHGRGWTSICIAAGRGARSHRALRDDDGR